MKVINHIALKYIKKMKKIQYLLSFMLLGFLTACEETAPILFRDAVVIFEGEEVFTIAESKDGANLEPNKTTITVSRANADVSQALTLNYTASAVFQETGANAAGTFSVSGTAGQIVIPANSYSTSFDVSSVNNLTADGAKEITITLSGASSNINLGYPGEASIKKSVKVIIEDDDCALDLSEFVGEYKITFNNSNGFYWGVAGFLDVAATYGYSGKTTIKLGANPNTLVDENFWSIPEDEPTSFNDAVVINVNPTSLSTSVSRQFLYAISAGRDTDGNGDGTATNPNLAGKINTCTKGFTTEFYIKNTTDSAIRCKVVITYTKL